MLTGLEVTGNSAEAPWLRFKSVLHFGRSLAYAIEAVAGGWIVPRCLGLYPSV